MCLEEIQNNNDELLSVVIVDSDQCSKSLRGIVFILYKLKMFQIREIFGSPEDA